MSEYIKLFNIVLLGNSNIGAKTSLMHRYIDNSFPSRTISTIGIDSRIKIVQTDFGKIKLKLWDAEGQERWHTISSTYVKGSHCIILGYDVTDRQSFEEIRKYWDNCVMENKGGDSPLMYLVGNKIDLIEERVVSDEEGKSLANDLNMKFFEVSAETGKGVDILLEDIGNSLIKTFTINKIDTNKSKKEDKSDKIKIALNKYLNY